MAEWEAWQQYYWQQEQQQQQQQQQQQASAQYLHEQNLHQQHVAHMEQQALSMMYQGATLLQGGYHLNYQEPTAAIAGAVDRHSSSLCLFDALHLTIN